MFQDFGIDGDFFHSPTVPFRSYEASAFFQADVGNFFSHKASGSGREKTKSPKRSSFMPEPESKSSYDDSFSKMYSLIQYFYISYFSNPVSKAKRNNVPRNPSTGCNLYKTMLTITIIAKGAYPIAVIWPEIVCQTFVKYDEGILPLYHSQLFSHQQKNRGFLKGILI